MIIGSHVSMSGKKMFLGSVETSIANGANALMIYTGAPQNTRRKAIEELRIKEGVALLREHNFKDVIVHAPYIVNLGNTFKPDSFEFAVEFLKEEVKRADALGASQLVLHPGAHVGAGADAAIQSIITGLNRIISPDQQVKIALETMAGKGTEVAVNFQQIKQIIDGVEHDEKLSVCFDTCHTNDAGYLVKDDFDQVMEEFDQTIGLDRIGVIHLNDSKNIIESHKDRHENLGFGTIGFDALNYIANFERLKSVPKILETPLVKDENDKKHSPYRLEIEMLKQGQFDPTLIQKIKSE
jgi:deoxyribonuclease-4